jgi:hypothetical protein
MFALLPPADALLRLWVLAGAASAAAAAAGLTPFELKLSLGWCWL